MTAQIINGIILGTTYALIAAGLTLIFGTMKLLNFSHGEFYMLGGYFLYIGTVNFGLHPIPAVIFALIGVALVGFIVHKGLLQYILKQAGWDVSPLVLTLGLMFFFQNFALLVWGERFRHVPYFIDGTFTLLGTNIAYQRLLVFIVSFSVIIFMWIFLQRSKIGLAMRATSQDRDVAYLMGIDVYRVYTVTFIISVTLGALAATLLSPIFLINPWMGMPHLMRSLFVVVLGGLGSFEGAILGGLLLGTVESVAVLTLGSEWKDLAAFSILIIVLWVKPSGLFGKKEW